MTEPTVTPKPTVAGSSSGASPETPSESVNDPAADAPPVPDLHIKRGAVGALQAGEVVVSVGAIGAAQADRVSVELGAIGAAAANEIRVSTGSVGLALARDARFEQALVRSVVAQRVTMARGSAAGIVIAARVDGDGRALLDWRGGVLAGTIVALVWLIVRRLR